MVIDDFYQNKMNRVDLQKKVPLSVGQSTTSQSTENEGAANNVSAPLVLQCAGAQATSPPATTALTCLDGAQATQCSAPVISQCAGAQATSPPAVSCLDGAQATQRSTPVVSKCAGAQASSPPADPALTCCDEAQAMRRKPTLLEIAKALCVNAVWSSLCLGDQGTLKNKLSLIKKQQK